MNSQIFLEDRPATHAGSWYSANARELRDDINQWLTAEVEKPMVGIKNSRIILTPHAGYMHSGEVSARSFASIDTKHITRVIILGPNHTQYQLTGCAVSCYKSYQCPLGSLKVDQKMAQTFLSSNAFSVAHAGMDLDEHSIEMQIPMIIALFLSRNLPLPLILPVFVGSLGQTQISDSITLLADELNKENTVAVISTDFCHWGERFQYKYLPLTNDKTLTINDRIRQLDNDGLKAITSLRVDDFIRYLNRTQNTICGRNPIIVMLKIIEKLGLTFQPKVEWLKYKHSNEITPRENFLVAYAAGCVTLTNKY